MLIDRQAGVWDTRRAEKAGRLARAAPLASGKVIPTQKATDALDALLKSGDKVILEGDNQKQADFLSRSLAAVDPGRVHDRHLLISFSRPEQLDLFEDGIASRTDFAYAGAQSVRVARLLAEAKMQVDAIYTYVEPSGRLFVDLLPRVARPSSPPIGTATSTPGTPTVRLGGLLVDKLALSLRSV